MSVPERWGGYGQMLERWTDAGEREAHISKSTSLRIRINTSTS